MENACQTDKSPIALAFCNAKFQSIPAAWIPGATAWRISDILLPRRFFRAFAEITRDFALQNTNSASEWFWRAAASFDKAMPIAGVDYWILFPCPGRVRKMTNPSLS
jgi:hypothetical protein